MKRFNSVFVVPVRSLEVGDLIAKEFLGGVISGKVTGLVHYAQQLTDEQREYLEKKGLLNVPMDEFEDVAGPSMVLIFGLFKGEGINKDQPDHMFVNLDTNVAVFPTSREG